MAKKKNLCNYGKSVKERLLNISRDEQYSSQQMLSRYSQERLLYRLSGQRIQGQVYLEGWCATLCL